MKSIPKDCTQCEFSSCCSSYYGGSTCRYEDEINEKKLKSFWGKVQIT